MNRKTLAFILIIILSSFYCKEDKPVTDISLTESSIPKEGILPYFKGEVLDPYWPENAKFPEDLRRFPDIDFISQNNAKFNRDSIKGKYALIIFFYARCNGVCPMLTRNMVNFLPKIQDQSDLEVVSITINPDEENPDVLKKFRDSYKIKQDNWVFLTGSRDTIHKLATKQFGAGVQMVNGANDLKEFVHTENVFLLDRNGYLRGVYRAKGTGDLDRLLIELKTLRESDRKT